MAKLYFKFGAMKSGKTTDLIKTWYNYTEQGFNPIIIKPGIDKKAGSFIQNRAGDKLKVDFVIANDDIYNIVSKTLKNKKIDIILVDESQFFDSFQIDRLSNIVDDFDIPVICYGLRADFQSKLFPGSKRLFEVADVLEELKAVCKCGDKATFNMRLDKDNETKKYIPVFEGPQVSIDGIDSEYEPVCRSCYNKAKQNINK